MQNLEIPELVIPEEAAKRGPILTGELRSATNRFPSMMVQFSRFTPSSRKARIHLLLMVDQAKALFVISGPFSFEGSCDPQEGVTEIHHARDIWLKSISQIVRRQAVYWSQTSGEIGSIEIKTVYKQGYELNHRSSEPEAWFVARQCFALQVLANADKDEAALQKKYGFAKEDVFLEFSDGAKAEIQRYAKSQQRCVDRGIKKKGYAITLTGFKTPESAKQDVDAFLILASFASREQTVCAHWSVEETQDWVRQWRFNFGKFPRRMSHENPLIQRDREECRSFLQKAFQKYQQSNHRSALESAIYALLDRDQTNEMRIAHLFFGIQSALMFATQYPASSKRPQLGVLYRRFSKDHPGLSDDLWPLLDPKNGTPLAYIRHAIVHGETFSESDFLALSFAGQNLQWHLERIILVALEWDVEKSDVSARSLSLFYAHNWQSEQKKLKLK